MSLPKAFRIGDVHSPPSIDLPSHRRVTALDGLRGVAILSVIAFHTLRVKGSGDAVLMVWRAIQESTWAGVDLFFVLSGFLITGILLDSRSDGRYFRNFYARRTLRIMPLYYVVLLTVMVVVPVVIGRTHLPPLFSRLLSNQIWLWTYLQNYLQSTGSHTLPGLGHFWSLAVEEQFYWFWPLIVYGLSKRNLLRACVLVCLFEPFFRWFLLHSGVSVWAIRQYTFTRMDTLLYGAIGAILLRGPAPKRLRFLPSWLVAGSLVALGIEVADHGFIPYEGKETVVLGYSAVAMLFATAVYHAASDAGIAGKLLSSSFLGWFGKYSYAIYIFHWPITQVYEAVASRRLEALPRFVAAACCFLAVTTLSSGIGVLSWRLLESRFLKLKKYFEYGQEPAGAIEIPLTMAQAAGPMART